MVEEYQVGNSTPIKVKVSVQTEGIAIVYAELVDSQIAEDGITLEEAAQIELRGVEPYNPKLQQGWKELSDNPIQGDTAIIVTHIYFPRGVNNELIFGRAVLQAKETYEVELKGGNPERFEAKFEVSSDYSTKTCFIRSEVKLI